MEIIEQSGGGCRAPCTLGLRLASLLEELAELLNKKREESLSIVDHPSELL